MSARRLPVLFLAALTACGGDASTTTQPRSPTQTAPPIAREMRGLWVATVANIDWPSKPGLPADQQRAELTSILDRAASLGLNAIVLQVRPNADALYASTLEPWGAMLTGRQGGDPGYDPLVFAIAEAHKRGLELHAWINPFRAGTSKDSASLAPTHVFNTQRSLVRVYGTQLWLDPGEPAAQDWSLNVVSDIVRRYDIDAVHADDYFYPYPENNASGKAIVFPDSASYAKSGSMLSRDDWRRANIDRFVERLYAQVHAIKPAVKVGIAPFGIWRPGNPPGVAGLDAYATIYADSRKWLDQGWVDYFAPQLYWAIAAPQQSFPALLAWWASQNSKGRTLVPGLAAYKVINGSFSSNEIADQIAAARAQSGASGHILYNTNSTMRITGSLGPLYADKALVPASPWLDATVPAKPAVSLAGRTVQLTPGDAKVRWWAIRAHTSAGWTTTILFGDQRAFTLSADVSLLVVNAVSASGVLSADATASSG